MRAGTVLYSIVYTIVYMYLHVNGILFHVTFSAADGALLFPGRKLAELMVELKALLNSEDIRFFENNM